MPKTRPTFTLSPSPFFFTPDPLVLIRRGRVDSATRQGEFGFVDCDRLALRVRVAGDEAEDEVAEDDCADGEGRVADGAHPAQVVHQAGLEELRRARVPGAVLDRGPRLHQPDEIG